MNFKKIKKKITSDDNFKKCHKKLKDLNNTIVKEIKDTRKEIRNKINESVNKNKQK
jgi:hypothetical protein